jgi:CubicO group peptidase (beta-lactamase class C family)
MELDVDVNEYLPPGLAVDNTCATPVTLARLLTHTSGYTDAVEADDDAAADRSPASSPGVEVRAVSTGLEGEGHRPESFCDEAEARC